MAPINRLKLDWDDAPTTKVDEEEIEDRRLARLYHQPVSVFEYLRKCHRPLWVWLRETSSLSVSRRIDEDQRRARREWRMMGLMCWFVTFALMLGAPQTIDITDVVIAAIGAFCQWQSTCEAPQ